MDETITIPVTEYAKLLKDQQWLECLEACGVDNWQGFDAAADIYRDAYPEEVNN